MIQLSVQQICNKLHDLIKNDFYGLVVISGDTGTGKSTLGVAIAETVSKLTGVVYTIHKNMTYRREEVFKMISEFPEYSVIHIDELISLLYKRNWQDDGQIDMIELFNKCRDRHLIIIGMIPNFWDLDKGVYNHVNLWIHVYKRGRAWAFIKSKDPFETDVWLKKKNHKLFQQFGTVFKSPNYLGNLTWPDWTPEKKAEYYAVRNEKRKGTEGQRASKGYHAKRAEKWQERAAKILLYARGLNGFKNDDCAKFIEMRPQHLSELSKFPN